MRVLMLGRGVISTVYGKAFADAGHDVAFAVRPNRMDQYGAPLQIDLIDGRRTVLGERTRTTFEPALVEIPNFGGGFDVIVLSVGHHRLAEAAALVAAHVGDATVLVFGNVWESLSAAAAPLPANQVLFGFPGAGGGFGEDGVLRGTLFRSVTLDAGRDEDPWRQCLVRGMFSQAGFAIKEKTDMQSWLWLHFAMDVGMFSQALQVGGLANMIGDRRSLGEAFRTSREMLPVLEARGMDLSSHRKATLPARLPRSAGAASGWATRFFRIAQVSLAAHTDPNAIEPRAVIADALATARRLDIATPRLERAVEGA